MNQYFNSNHKPSSILDMGARGGGTGGIIHHNKPLLLPEVTINSAPI